MTGASVGAPSWWSDGALPAEQPLASDAQQPCIFTRRWESIPVTRYPDVIDRFSLGPPRPERSLGRHVHSFESPTAILILIFKGPEFPVSS
jgi:hypothetical protein